MPLSGADMATPRLTPRRRWALPAPGAPFGPFDSEAGAEFLPEARRQGRSLVIERWPPHLPLSGSLTCRRADPWVAYDLIVRRLDPPALYAALDAERACRGLTWNQVAADAGVSVGTIRRLRANGRFETDGILSLTQWLGRPVEEFTRPDS